MHSGQETKQCCTYQKQVDYDQRPKRSKPDENVMSLTETLTERIRKMDEMMKSLEKSFNKTSESHACVLSDCKEQGVKVQKRKIRNKKYNEVSHTEKHNKLK